MRSQKITQYERWMTEVIYYMLECFKASFISICLMQALSIPLAAWRALGSGVTAMESQRQGEFIVLIVFNINSYKSHQANK